MASPSLKPMRFNIFSISVFSINVNTGDTSYVYLRRKQGTNITGMSLCINVIKKCAYSVSQWTSLYSVLLQTTLEISVLIINQKTTLEYISITYCFYRLLL